MSRILLSICLLSIICQFYVNAKSIHELDHEARIVIKDYVQSLQSTRVNANATTLCTTNNCCTISDSQSCPLSYSNSEFLVLPGGETSCIFDSSTPYAFQVFPGDSDSLLFYFQGGGACWDKASTQANLCTTDSSPSSSIGIFQQSNPLNPFRKYTIVQALYCSGDVFGGNVTQPYTVNGSPVIQHGIQNAEATLNWIVEQQKNGLLSSTLTNLVISGDSAGAIGAQIWGTTVLDSLKWQHAAVLPDSYAGVFPEGTQGPFIYSYGMCSWDKFPADYLQSCLDKTLTLQDMMEYFFKLYPNIPFGFIQSKVDVVQQSFYVAVGATFAPGSGDGKITPDVFYKDLNEIFGNYSANNPNFITYLVDGDTHTYTPREEFYTADALGPRDMNSADNTDLVMTEWCRQFPVTLGRTVSTVCLGDLIDPGARVGKDDTYCSTKVVPKSFTPTIN